MALAGEGGRRRDLALGAVAGAVAAAGGLHVLLRTSGRGAALSADSVAMWSASVNLVAGEGFLDFTGEPFAMWPPLFPLVLAAGAWAGIDPPEAGRWLNAAAFAATILLAGRWLAGLARSRMVVAGGVLAIAASYPLNVYAAYLLTEASAVFLVMGALLHLDKFLHRRGRTSALLWASAFAGLGATTRYAGVATVLAGAAALLANRRAPLADRLRHASAFGVLSSAPLALVLAWNWAVSGTPAGDRGIYLQPGLLESVVASAKAVSTWAIPGAGPAWLDHAPWIAAAATPFVVAVALVAIPRVRRRGAAAVPAVDPAARICLLFAATYVVFLFAATTWAAGQPVDSRYLLPVYVPLVVAGALFADRFLSLPAPRTNAFLKPAAGFAALAGCLIHLGFAVHANIAVTAAWIDRGDSKWAAYNSAHWDASETLRAAAGERMDGVVYSNDAALLWYHDAGAPPGTYRHLPLTSQRLARGLEPGAGIVWFDGMLFGAAEYDAGELAAMPGIEAVAEWTDGRLLRTGPGSPNP